MTTSGTWVASAHSVRISGFLCNAQAAGRFLFALSTKILVLQLLLVAAVAVYRLFFHPLRRYPGPLLHRISGLPTLYHCWKGDLHYHTWELHQRYGDKIRYSPNKLSFNHAQAWQDIYGYGQNASKPEEFYSAFRVHPKAINTFNTSSKQIHRRKRKIMSKAFSTSVLNEYEPWIGKRLDELVEKLGDDSVRKPRTSFNMASLFEYFTLDVFGGICFGETFGFISGEETELVSQFHKRAFRIHMTGHEHLLRDLRLDRVLFRASAAAAGIIASHARNHTINRLKRYKSENASGEKDTTTRASMGYSDILAHLIESQDEETGTAYSENELVGEGILILIAGFDTTSTVLSSALWHVLTHPHVHATLIKELNANYTSATDVDFKSLGPLTYLRAIMWESMRLAPAFPAISPRVADPGGLKVLDTVVPEGTWVGVPPWTINRNSSYFDSPHSFIPERWIVGTHQIGHPSSEAGTSEPLSQSITMTEADLKQAETAFQPFQLGPRHCIGKHLAVREVMLVLARLFLEFDFDLVPDSRGAVSSNRRITGIDLDQTPVFEQTDVFTSIEHGPVVRVRRKVELEPQHV